MGGGEATSTGGDFSFPPPHSTMTAKYSSVYGNCGPHHAFIPLNSRATKNGRGEKGGSRKFCGTRIPKIFDIQIPLFSCPRHKNSLYSLHLQLIEEKNGKGIFFSVTA